MIRNDLQHIQLDSQSQRRTSVARTRLQLQLFLRLKALNSNLKKDIENSITLILVLAFLKFKRALYHYVCASPGPFNMLDFQQPKKVMLLRRNLAGTKGLSIAFDLPTHRGFRSRTRSG
jgi:hypothetical protein